MKPFRKPGNRISAAEISMPGIFALGMILLLSGGYHEYAAMLLLMVLSVLLILRIKKEKDGGRGLSGSNRPTFPFSAALRSPAFLFPAALMVFSALMAFWAVDPGMHMAGMLKRLPLLLWMLLIFLLSPEERVRILETLPWFGVAEVALGLIFLPFPGLRPLLWSAERLGGTFQYSNTCAIFLAAGLIILSRTGWTAKRKALLAAILLFGILLTGSRGVLLLTLGWGVLCVIFRPEMRKAAAAFFFGGLGAVLIISAVTGTVQNIGRILTVAEHTSTLFGRLLYMKDALRMVLRFPLGLGFRGYSFLQPVLQNGVYETRYVHNDYLQALLDLGLLPGILLLLFLMWQLFAGKQEKVQKEVLALFMAGSLFDFHFQYLSILMLLVLCMDPEAPLPFLSGKRKAGEKGALRGKHPGKEALRKEHFGKGGSGVIAGAVTAVAIGLFLLGGVFLIPFLSYRLGEDRLTLTVCPGYTDAGIRLLSKAEDAGEAEALSRELLKRNPYVSDAWRNLVFIHAMREETGEMLQCMDRALEIDRYRTEEYRAYDELLYGMAEEALSEGREETAAMLSRERDRLPERLLALKETTDPLAYRIKDQPVFTYERMP